MGEIGIEGPGGSVQRRMPVALAAQGIALSALLCFVTLAPPAEGRMLLVPMTQTTGQTLDSALGRGVRLVGRGPLPDSIVVEGRRDAILPGMLAAGTLVLASSTAWCGTAA